MSNRIVAIAVAVALIGLTVTIIGLWMKGSRTTTEIMFGGDAPITWTSASPGLPTWASLSDSGLLSGSPKNPDIVTTSPLPQATPLAVYSIQFIATGEPPLRWRVVNMPWWCTLSPEGYLRIRWWPFWQTKPITITLTSENKYGITEHTFSISPKKHTSVSP